MEFSLFCDSHHGKDPLEMGIEAKGLDCLAPLICGDHHVDHESDATRVEILDLGVFEEDAFRAFHRP